jgi:hypothetical protein
MTRRSVLLALAALAAPVFAEDTFSGVERVVAIGDLHGDFERFTDLLRTAKLTDQRNSWIGGKSHLVITGDFLDRGDGSSRIMDLLIALEPQAKKAGGEVHVLIGNHEAMNLYGDLRYVTKGDFDSYRTPNSAEARARALEQTLDALKDQGKAPLDEAAFRRKYEEEHPLGWVEQRIAFTSRGKYGQWLAKKDAVIKINDMIFLHGGISAKFAEWSIRDLNEAVSKELGDFAKLENGIVTDPEGPLWYRGLAEDREDNAATSAAIDQALKKSGAKHIVIGHTPQNAILPRFGGKVIVIDVGLSSFYNGPPAFLVMENKKLYAVHRGRQLELPANGEPVLPYLRAASLLEPQRSRLRDQVEQLIR